MNEPKLYLKSCFAQQECVRKLWERHAKSLPWTDGEHILDVGVGCGSTLTQIVLPFLPSDSLLTGLDISESMLEFARQHCSHDRVQYVMEDIQKDLTTSWQPELFHKIISFYCFHWLTDYKQTAINLHHLQKKNGHCFIHLAYSHPFIDATSILAEQPQWKPYMTDFESGGLGFLKNLKDPEVYLSGVFKSAGYEILESYIDNHVATFPSVEQLMDLYESGKNKLIGKVPEDKLKQCLQQVQQEILKLPEVKSGPEGQLTISWNNVIVIAKK